MQNASAVALACDTFRPPLTSVAFIVPECVKLQGVGPLLVWATLRRQQ